MDGTQLTRRPVEEFRPKQIGLSIGGRVLIAHQHALRAESLAVVLHLSSVATFIVSDGSPSGVVRHAQAFDPDLVLLGAVGTECVPTVRALGQVGVKVLVITDGTNRSLMAECIEAGASGIVAFTDPVGQLLYAVQETVAGRRLFSVGAARQLLDELAVQRRDDAGVQSGFERLSRRESEVLWALMMGESPGEVATSSYVSMATIRSQIKMILRKLGVHSTLAAVALAYRAGWSPHNAPLR